MVGSGQVKVGIPLPPFRAISITSYGFLKHGTGKVTWDVANVTSDISQTGDRQHHPKKAY